MRTEVNFKDVNMEDFYKLERLCREVREEDNDACISVYLNNSFLEVYHTVAWALLGHLIFELSIDFLIFPERTVDVKEKCNNLKVKSIGYFLSTLRQEELSI